MINLEVDENATTSRIHQSLTRKLPLGIVCQQDTAQFAEPENTVSPGQGNDSAAESELQAHLRRSYISPFVDQFSRLLFALRAGLRVVVPMAKLSRVGLLYVSVVIVTIQYNTIQYNTIQYKSITPRRSTPTGL
jgi:hypothetical protein